MFKAQCCVNIQFSRPVREAFAGRYRRGSKGFYKASTVVKRRVSGAVVGEAPATTTARLDGVAATLSCPPHFLFVQMTQTLLYKVIRLQDIPRI